MTRRLLPLVVAAGAAVSSCGSHARPVSSAQSLFTQACGACHTLTGHDDPRRQGGDLLGFHATRRQFLQLASEMPVRHPLTQAQRNAVVRFVMRREAGGS